jgi:hypothetical protein
VIETKKRRQATLEPEPPKIAVTNLLELVRDKKRAAELFNAILKGVQKANARVAREREEAANGNKGDH